jgi:bacterioferritin
MDGLAELRAAVSYCESHKDFVSRDLFDSILKSEEAHIDWLETQLGLVEQLGIQNYLQSAK